MCVIKCGILLVLVFVTTELVSEVDGDLASMLDFRYFRCVMKREWKCPDSEINFFMYTPEHPKQHFVDPRHPKLLRDYGWKKTRKNVLIIHGFNGTYSKTPMTFIRDAYLSRKDYNVFMVDWSMLTRFPCYLSALSNMKKAAQCTAQLYSAITQAGALAKMITCVGHSLGAHICGMISNHLTEKQYKIFATRIPFADAAVRSSRVLLTGHAAQDRRRVIVCGYKPHTHQRSEPSMNSELVEIVLAAAYLGLDPGRPLVSAYGSRQFRLSRDDAYVVQVMHTNAGFLGEDGLVGHADFCVNGGRLQPGCKGHAMRIARCSHFMSACYFAASVRKKRRLVGIPCESTCPKERGHWGIKFDRKAVMLGEDVPDSARGMYCISFDHNEDCPFD